MEKFISKNFIKSLRERYDAIPYHGNDNAAKKLVVDSIKSGYSLEDTLSFISKELKLSIDEKELIKRVIKAGGPIAKNLAVYQESLKGKISNEEMLSLAAMCCEKDIETVKAELSIDCYGWKNAVETILKSKPEKTVKKEKPVKKEPVKPEVKRSHRKSITLINIETGEKRSWETYSDCDKEFGKKRGTTSQLVSGKVKRINGVWKLYKVEEETLTSAKKVVEKKEGSRMRPILQIKIDTKGKEKVVRRFKSITEASKITGIKHSSICKNAKGLYQSAGGFVWRYGEIAA